MTKRLATSLAALAGVLGCSPIVDATGRLDCAGTEEVRGRWVLECMHRARVLDPELDWLGLCAQEAERVLCKREVRFFQGGEWVPCSRAVEKETLDECRRVAGLRTPPPCGDAFSPAVANEGAAR